MNKAPIFVPGMKVFKPSPKAPEFVKGQLVINKLELLDFLKSQRDEVRIDIKEGRSGVYYLSVNDWTPTTTGRYANEQRENPSTDELPF